VRRWVLEVEGGSCDAGTRIQIRAQVQQWGFAVGGSKTHRRSDDFTVVNSGGGTRVRQRPDFTVVNSGLGAAAVARRSACVVGGVPDCLCAAGGAGRQVGNYPNLLGPFDDDLPILHRPSIDVLLLKPDVSVTSRLHHIPHFPYQNKI
jgi:hypothetical protein